MRLDKFLCDMQLGTRSQVKDLIKKVRYLSMTRLSENQIFADAARDHIACMGKSIVYQSLYYYMLHKPAGVVTATRDNHESTVMSLLPDASGKHLAPVGRLDKDTEGAFADHKRRRTCPQSAVPPAGMWQKHIMWNAQERFRQMPSPCWKMA